MKAITAPEIRATALLVAAVDTLMAEFSGTKTAGDFGVMTRARARRVLAQRALARDRRGGAGQGGT